MRKLDEEKIRDRLRGIAGWTHCEYWIEKKYEFKSFVRAMMFVNAVAYIAESMNHHPDITIHYREVTLRNWTHVVGGLTERDFVLAEKIEQLCTAYGHGPQI